MFSLYRGEWNFPGFFQLTAAAVGSTPKKHETNARPPNVIPVVKKTLLALLCSATVLHAAPPASDELLAGLQTCMENGKSIAPLLEHLDDLPSAELKKLSAALEKAWPQIRTQYISALEKTAKTISSGPEKNKNQARMRELRDQFQQVYRLDENAMKPLLKTKSMPAVEDLQKLMLPQPETVIKAGGKPLADLRHGATTLATFRDAVLNTDLSTTPADAIATLQAAEKKAAEEISALDKDALRILDMNAKIAAKEEVPAEEARGIEECNLWRLLVGLNACVLDPQLCAAARDHSKDMAEKGFFAHESPVPGKTSPWDRAKNFNTTASGENIFAGSPSSRSANIGWFYSPGHHKNMFSPGQVRIGLGQHGSHWTQMFGR